MMGVGAPGGEVTNQWCDAHWKPYRRDRTLNGLLATILLVQKFMQAHDAEAKGDQAVMDRLLIQKSPVCCWAGEDALELILEQATRVKGAA